MPRCRWMTGRSPLWWPAPARRPYRRRPWHRHRHRHRPARTLQTADPGGERRLVLPGDHPRRQLARHQLTTDRGIQPVEADRQPGVVVMHSAPRAEAQAHRGVHRHREGDRLRPPHGVGIPGLHAEIQAADVVPGATQRGRRRRDVQRLVAQLIGRDQQYAHVSPTLARGRRLVPARSARAARSGSAAGRGRSRRELSTAAGVAARANMKPRYRSPSGNGSTGRPRAIVISRPTDARHRPSPPAVRAPRAARPPPAIGIIITPEAVGLPRHVLETPAEGVAQDHLLQAHAGPEAQRAGAQAADRAAASSRTLTRSPSTRSSAWIGPSCRPSARAARAGDRLDL